MNTIVLATRNRDKAQEFEQLLRGYQVEFKTLNDFPSIPETVEDAGTLEGNALKKAREASQMTGLPSLGDDTGLEVHYLNDQPGVYSSRYAGPGATYEQNCKKLLRVLKGVPPRRRMARFRCVLAFVPSAGTEILVEGIVRGAIVEGPRGANGFGYDPLFVPDGGQKTLAELEPEEKNALSHRGKAAENLRKILSVHLAQS
jgi:XTP/dITP diphosphohydrolase